MIGKGDELMKQEQEREDECPKHFVNTSVTLRDPQENLQSTWKIFYGRTLERHGHESHRLRRHKWFAIWFCRKDPH